MPTYFFFQLQYGLHRFKICVNFYDDDGGRDAILWRETIWAIQPISTTIRHWWNPTTNLWCGHWKEVTFSNSFKLNNSNWFFLGYTCVYFIIIFYRDVKIHGSILDGTATVSTSYTNEEIMTLVAIGGGILLFLVCCGVCCKHCCCPSKPSTVILYQRKKLNTI